MKITRKQLRRITERVGGGGRYSEIPAHPRGDLGKNIADVDFPIVVGYELQGKQQSEIAYNQDELDSILDNIAPSYGPPGIPYSLNSLSEIEPDTDPVGSSIDRYSEGKMKITKRQLRRIIREEKQKLMKEASPADMSMHDAAEHYEKQRVPFERIVNNLYALADVAEKHFSKDLARDLRAQVDLLAGK